MKILLLKFGSKLLTGKRGRLDQRYLNDIGAQIAYAKKQGWSVAAVSSGAVLTGYPQLTAREKGGGEARSYDPASDERIRTSQIASMVGQGLLMERWRRSLSPHGLIPAMGLLTDHDLKGSRNQQDRRRLLLEIFERYPDVVPVHNENDFTCAHELLRLGHQGDNDCLTKEIALMLKGRDSIEVFVALLTDVPGLIDERGQVVARVTDVRKAMQLVLKQKHTAVGVSRGGMESKITVGAELVNKGIRMLIANGRESEVICRIADGNFPGTIFVTQGQR